MGFLILFFFSHCLFRQNEQFGVEDVTEKEPLVVCESFPVATDEQETLPMPLGEGDGIPVPVAEALRQHEVGQPRPPLDKSPQFIAALDESGNAGVDGEKENGVEKVDTPEGNGGGEPQGTKEEGNNTLQNRKRKVESPPKEVAPEVKDPKEPKIPTKVTPITQAKQGVEDEIESETPKKALSWIYWGLQLFPFWGGLIKKGFEFEIICHKKVRI